MDPYGPGYDDVGGMRVERPLSWLVFVGGTLLAVVIFAPLAMMGWHFERIPVFLAGTGGFAVAALVAAFFGLRFTAALAAGHYKTVQPRPWREQVW